MTSTSGCARMAKMNIISKIVLCKTHRRFKKLFDKLERKGFNLYLETVWDESYQRRVNNYNKNLNKVKKLYDKFNGE